MSPKRIGKAAATTGSLGAMVAAAKVIAGQSLPPAGWVVLGTTTIASVAIACLSLILEYRYMAMEIRARETTAAHQARLLRARLNIYRKLAEKSADEPGCARAYQELIIADARHLAVENDVQPSGRGQVQLHAVWRDSSRALEKSPGIGKDGCCGRIGNLHAGSGMLMTRGRGRADFRLYERVDYGAASRDCSCRDHRQ